MVAILDFRRTILAIGIEDLDLILKERRLRWYGHGMDMWNAPMVQSRQPLTYRMIERVGLGGPRWHGSTDREGLQREEAHGYQNSYKTYLEIWCEICHECSNPAIWKGAHWCGCFPCTCTLINWHFGSREEVKNRFSRWPPRRPSWISDQINSFLLRKEFSYVWSSSHLDASNQVSSQFALRFRSEKWIFEMVAILDFHRTILAIFYLHITPMCLTKFQANWPFPSGEEAKKQIFKMTAMAAILDFTRENF